MCCLFGLVDVKHSLSAREKSWILSILGICAEVRGTDATGYSYNHRGKLIIRKKAVAARNMDFEIPEDAYVIMGHTRMTTQGAATHQRNNHPFLGKLPHTQFALAHNGILTNDRQLHLKEQLPRTEIETDSYVAVQLLEQEKSLDFTSLRNMAEKVQGTFTFTVMDQKNRLHIAKGNNPLCLYYFTAGFYLYASTKEILETALEAMGYLELPHEEIPISNGEILKIAPNGQRSSAWFQPPASMHYYMPFYDDAWEDVWYSMEQKEPEGYRKFLMEYSQSFGIPESQMQYLHQSGLSDLDLEECIWDPSFRSFWLSELSYYDEMEDFDEYECIASLPR